MPIAPTYPGVYVEEIPSGVRTIVGVPTSITAFIGRAKKGELNKPVTINNFGDFERKFGGRWLHSPMSYAVQDFFLNGGGQAIIVRVYKSAGGGSDSAKLEVGGLELIAVSPGLWGQNLRAEVIIPGNIPEELAERMGVQVEDLFNLVVTDGNLLETYNNVTVVESPRRLDRVLADTSQLVRYDGILNPETPPTVVAGQDPVLAKEEELKTAEPADKPAIKDAIKTLKTAMGGSDGSIIGNENEEVTGSENEKTGLYALEDADLFNLLCIPPYTYDPYNDLSPTVIDKAAAYCKKRRALLIIDPPNKWKTKDLAKSGVQNDVGAISQYAALFFPRIMKPNPEQDNQLQEFAPCGVVAGIFARTDRERGVWKAPAGLEATLVGVPQLTVALSNDENGELNPLGINCLRTLPAVGRVIWGARTREGNDQLASEWKYIPVRRLALYIEESLYRGLQWVVFEPNDEPLWAQIRLNVGAFMQNLFRQGAFQGRSPREAYFVKVDKETTTQNDINLGIVNIVVGFAPLKPAEFVILKLQQMAGQIEV